MMSEDTQKRPRTAVQIELERAYARSNELSKLYDIKVPDDLRTRLGATCFALAMDHSDAIPILLSYSVPAEASAFALVRTVFESYIRGLWITNCATEDELHAFATNRLRPKMRTMVEALDRAANTGTKGLTHSYGSNWDALCAYAHSGAHQVQRWNLGDSIQPNYKEAEVCEVLRFTGELALKAGLCIASLSSNQLIVTALTKQLDEFSRESRADTGSEVI